MTANRVLGTGPILTIDAQFDLVPGLAVCIVTGWRGPSRRVSGECESLEGDAPFANAVHCRNLRLYCGVANQSCCGYASLQHDDP